MRRILIHLDTDAVPSVFDRVVAVDAGVDELFSSGGIGAEMVEPLVHGAIFTRGAADLKNTAIFIGGSDVEAGEQVLKRVGKAFFGPLRVSVMHDSNGCNTTAAAAVLAACRHVDPRGRTALVLGGTGPVGSRAALLLAQRGSRVRLASRSPERARATVDRLRARAHDGELIPVAWSPATIREAAAGVEILISAGAAGAPLLSIPDRNAMTGLKVAIDLNAVPPAGLDGIEPADKAATRDGAICYGALGVGGTKMKIHKACLTRLFESNDQTLDTEAIYAIGAALVSAAKSP
jgi:predicted dinucleotide-binding enzyme